MSRAGHREDEERGIRQDNEPIPLTLKQWSRLPPGMLRWMSRKRGKMRASGPLSCTSWRFWRRLVLLGV